MEMSEAAKQKKREYMRKWRAQHPDNIRETQKRYWEKKVAESSKEETAEA